MVNKAIEEMMVQKHGEHAWAEVRRRAGVSDEVFISTEAYPDDITYRLVGAVSSLTGRPLDDVLREFGQHWILKTARAGYGHMIAAAGGSVPEFIGNLPRFHDRVALLYPKLVPPRFKVTDRGERSLRLHYMTERAGLTRFVEGLLIGIGRLFETTVEVRLEQRRADGAPADVFFVAW